MSGYVSYLITTGVVAGVQSDPASGSAPVSVQAKGLVLNGSDGASRGVAGSWQMFQELWVNVIHVPLERFAMQLFTQLQPIRYANKTIVSLSTKLSPT